MNDNSYYTRERLNNRLSEMTDRRRRLIKYMFKKENKNEQFESQYPVMIRRKDEVIQKFSSLQLEELLNNSTKNVAQEVVTCLIPRRGEGVLCMLEDERVPTSNANQRPGSQNNKQINMAHRQSNSQVAQLENDTGLPVKPGSSHKKQQQADSSQMHLPLINQRANEVHPPAFVV